MKKTRISHLKISTDNDNKQYVLYWMQQSMRFDYNHALKHAIDIANANKLPLLVIFSLTPNYLGANLRHYQFMLEGIREVEAELIKNNINFIIKLGEAVKTIPTYLEDAHTLVMDYGYLKPQLKWRRNIYNYIKDNNTEINIDMVESDVLVPVKTLYPKVAYGAYILRPHLMRQMEEYRDFSELPKIINKTNLKLKSDINLNDLDGLLKGFDINHSIKPYIAFKGGYAAARAQLERFINNKAKDYVDRSDPSLSIQSYLSPYLHFGQISPLEIIDIIEAAYEQDKFSREVYDAFIEQLVVRRELSFNFVTYRANYDTFLGMTENWAYESMAAHKDDVREHLYTTKQLENSLTHDKYFNAAMTEMRITGYMAGYMRMYWAKKIVEWTESMEVAFATIVYLNNKYFLDGRDANSYASIAWIFGKNDRPWIERPIFGKLRYMNDKGLERKFMIDKYVEQINIIESEM